MRIYKNIEWVITFIVLLGIVYGSYTLSKWFAAEPVEMENVTIKNVDVVLDAGHGGNDPGKVGVNGELEKDINMEIVYRIQDCLEAKGVTVALTRDGEGRDFSKKEDMKLRVDTINEIEPKLVISIHQNSYTDAEVKGAQVFYYKNSEESEAMAGILQEALREVDPENRREVKADDTYYMLTRTKVPTLIVECGFLSNPQEAEKLIEETYQQKLAEAIAEGIIACLDKNKIAAISI